MSNFNRFMWEKFSLKEDRDKSFIKENDYDFYLKKIYKKEFFFSWLKKKSADIYEKIIKFIKSDNRTKELQIFFEKISFKKIFLFFLLIYIFSLDITLIRAFFCISIYTIMKNYL